jgi:hypothetical protein
VADPTDSVYLWLGGSEIQDMAGWTHDAYGGVVIESTLTASNATRWATARNMIAVLAGGAVCAPSSP